MRKRQIPSMVKRVHGRGRHLGDVTVVLWTSSHILYGLLFHQKSDVSKATC